MTEAIQQKQEKDKTFHVEVNQKWDTNDQLFRGEKTGAAVTMWGKNNVKQQVKSLLLINEPVYIPIKQLDHCNNPEIGKLVG